MEVNKLTWFHTGLSREKSRVFYLVYVLLPAQFTRSTTAECAANKL